MMFRINKLTDYGVMLLAQMATEPDKMFTPAVLAKALRLPKPTVAKLLKRLTGAGILVSTRGKHGGYQLKIAPDKLSMAEVLTALEGPIGITDCSLGPGICQLEQQCRIGKGWQQFNRALYNELRALSLANLVTPVESDRSASNTSADAGFEEPIIREI